LAQISQEPEDLKQGPKGTAGTAGTGSGPHGPVIGFAGRFVEEKRPDLLIRALEVVNRAFPEARIVFAGQHQIPYEAYWPAAGAGVVVAE
jgi:glycosyltransferase involved in cell wall biosynthesis